jgi:hypothetical protein
MRIRNPDPASLQCVAYLEQLVYRPSTALLYFEPPSLQYESPGPLLLTFESPQRLKVDVNADSNSDPAFDFDADPDPLFHSDADLDPKL